MPGQGKITLSSFMKKQISEKSSKKAIAKKTPSGPSKGQAAKDGKEGDAEKNQDGTEEMTEEEQLEEAKKASRNKAAETDQTEMFKKLILENIVKYSVIIGVMVIFALGIIQLGPSFFAMLSGFVSKFLMAALRH